MFPNLEKENEIALDIETCDPQLKKLGAGTRRETSPVQVTDAK